MFGGFRGSRKQGGGKKAKRRDPFEEMGFGGFGSFGRMGGFEEDFFGGGFGGGSSFQSFSSSSFGGGPGSTSVKTQTYMQNGKTIKRTEKTIVDQNGQKRTEVTEEVADGSGRRTKNTHQITEGGKKGATKQVKYT